MQSSLREYVGVPSGQNAQAGFSSDVPPNGFGEFVGFNVLEVAAVQLVLSNLIRQVVQRNLDSQPVEFRCIAEHTPRTLVALPAVSLRSAGKFDAADPYSFAVATRHPVHDLDRGSP